MIVNKPYTNKDYADLAVYCNKNNCHIEDKGDYLESVPNEQYVPTHEDIRIMRQERYQKEADPIRYDYEEALARDEHEAVDLKRAWLDKKDEIRADLPYPDEGEE